MIEIKNLCKTFTVNGGLVEALSDVNLTINDGDIYGIIGMSGAGKSTLVRCINMLERPTEGSVLIDGRNIGLMNKEELREARRKITMIFQGFNLLQQKNCLDNIAFPLGLNSQRKKYRRLKKALANDFKAEEKALKEKRKEEMSHSNDLEALRTRYKDEDLKRKETKREAFNALAREAKSEISRDTKKSQKEKAMDLLKLVGLESKAKAYPSQLSGGQQQRIAIARALATDPKILLCDEATSALDPKTTRQILELIKKINKELGITVIIITHQMSVVEDACNKVAILDGGKVVEEGEVNKVFSHPESEAAKRLVYPEIEGEDEVSSSDTLRVRVVFNGALATSTPLVTRMAIDKNIIANILYASTKSIQDKLYGSMILGFKNDVDLDEVFSYLHGIEDIYAEVLE